MLKSKLYGSKTRSVLTLYSPEELKKIHIKLKCSGFFYVHVTLIISPICLSYRFALSFSSSSINPSKMLQSSLKKEKINIFADIHSFSHLLVYIFLPVHVRWPFESRYVLLITDVG